MLVTEVAESFICARCLHKQRWTPAQIPPREFCSTARRPLKATSTLPQNGESESYRENDEEKGAMSRRLSEMTTDSFEHGGRAARKAMKETGFSEDLKQRLIAKVEGSKFRSENSAAFVQLNMPSGAGQGTKEHATAEPWSGSESVEDAALRMLNDAHKPLRGSRPSKAPQSRPTSVSVDMRMKKAVQKSQGERLANARDRTSIYALSQDSNLSEKEKDEMRKVLKERFTSGARPMPSTVQGLAALANERIEDAISRGQFNNIPRGKGKNIERDYTASSPFLDTTEYFMNKIIQKQDIVPPWIEKQQELVKGAQVFRTRLRADWKRHAARMISSLGGPLDAQVKRAEIYAAAEAANNPKAAKVEALSEIDMEGRLSQVTITESPTPMSASQDSKITVSEDLASSAQESVKSISESSPNANSSQAVSKTESSANGSQLTAVPFRDPSWESLEHAYHSLAISSLNSLTRSYNLMAPDLAKKPYFNLDRELRSCFADVAPQLPSEIRDRAQTPEKIRVEVVGHRPGGVLERFGGGDRARVFDSIKPNYGFKEFWRDLWGKETRA